MRVRSWVGAGLGVGVGVGVGAHRARAGRALDSSSRLRALADLGNLAADLDLAVDLAELRLQRAPCA